MNGYHKMISDHLLTTWDMAFRLCKCRMKMINFIYDIYIKPYNTDYHSVEWRNKKKSETVKRICTKNNFKDIIPFEELSHKDLHMCGLCLHVQAWINWFAKYDLFVQDSIRHYQYLNLSFDEAIEYLFNDYNLSRNVAIFILKYYNYDN